MSKTKFEESMEDLLDLEPNDDSVFELPQRTQEPTELKPIEEKSNSFDEDFEYARENLKELIETGKSSLMTLEEFTRISESPRSFEVFATLTKTLIDAQTTLIDNHKKKAEIEKIRQKDEKEEPKHVQNNTQYNIAFRGSTADLLKQIKSDK